MVQRPLDYGAGRRLRDRLRDFFHQRVAHATSGGASHGVPRADVRYGRLPDDRARIRALRQPGYSADSAANAIGIPGAPGRHRHGAARIGFVRGHAAGRHHHVEVRSAEALELWDSRGRVHALSTFLAQPERRLLGHLLAADHSGRFARVSVRPAHHHHHGPGSKRGDGERHQHLQPDAEYRRQHGHCGRDHSD